MEDAGRRAVVMVTLLRHPAGSSLRTFASSGDKMVTFTTKVTLLGGCFPRKAVVADKLNNWTPPARRSKANGM